MIHVFTHKNLRSVHHTAEMSLVPFKGTIRRNPFRGEQIYHERKDLKYKMLIYCIRKMF